MKRIWFALLVALLFVGCSSDNDETNTVNSHTVTLSDVKGTWVVVSAMPQSVVGIRLVLNDKTNCVWSDKFDNTFSGPYYFLENIDDAVLKEQCALIASDVNDKIHINDIKVLWQNVGNAHLYIMCDLMPLLPSVNWQYFNERVDRTAWYFWENNWFKFTFEIVDYSENSMQLKLLDSDIRYDDYESSYPLRLSNGSVLTLQRQI